MSELLNRLGIQNRLQLAITTCVISLIVITTLGGSGGATPVFFIYRTLLLLITILCIVACRNQELRIAPALLASRRTLALALMLVSMLRIRGSHFEGFYLWYKHAFFIAAFLALAWYSRSQPFRWKATILTAVVVLNVVHLVPDLVRYNQPFGGFSTNNVNYFGTFLLTGLAVAMSVAVFGSLGRVRIAAGATAALIFFGITQTWSRGATLAAGHDARDLCRPRRQSHTAPGMGCHRCSRFDRCCGREPLHDGRSFWIPAATIRTTTPAPMCGAARFS